MNEHELNQDNMRLEYRNNKLKANYRKLQITNSQCEKRIKALESKLAQLTTLKELSENLLEIMITDLRSRPDKPFIASSTKSYTTHELAIEFSKRTPEGIGFLNDLIQLTIDRVSRCKEKLSPKEEEQVDENHQKYLWRQANSTFWF